MWIPRPRHRKQKQPIVNASNTASPLGTYFKDETAARAVTIFEGLERLQTISARAAQMREFKYWINTAVTWPKHSNCRLNDGFRVAKEPAFDFQ